MKHGAFFLIHKPKKQSLEWHIPSSPRKKKVRPDKSKGKVMLVVFFDYQRLVYYEFIKSGLLLINRHTKKYLCAFKKRNQLFKLKHWKLLNDNAPAHRAIIVQDYLDKHTVSVLSHPPYSPDIAPCDLFFFPKLKMTLKGRRFSSLSEVTENATATHPLRARTNLQRLLIRRMWPTSANWDKAPLHTGAVDGLGNRERQPDYACARDVIRDWPLTRGLQTRADTRRSLPRSPPPPRPPPPRGRTARSGCGAAGGMGGGQAEAGARRTDPLQQTWGESAGHDVGRAGLGRERGEPPPSAGWAAVVGRHRGRSGRS
ncbi:hypothetical protein LAZ67_8000504 [Cordylochernes scorpioides]|uniref:Transposase n=1 Tax=Cordylochernes scorpioides TaxID=51811 RepID=A0ABY6KT27_9ARAC|nr:hypothetical protein LAZ67_8000504 [Cordylochernes scorpioides]